MTAQIAIRDGSAPDPGVLLSVTHAPNAPPANRPELHIILLLVSREHAGLHIGASSSAA